MKKGLPFSAALFLSLLFAFTVIYIYDCTVENISQKYMCFAIEKPLFIKVFTGEIIQNVVMYNKFRTM